MIISETVKKIWTFYMHDKCFSPWAAMDAAAGTFLTLEAVETNADVETQWHDCYVYACEHQISEDDVLKFMRLCNGYFDKDLFWEFRIDN